MNETCHLCLGIGASYYIFFFCCFFFLCGCSSPRLKTAKNTVCAQVSCLMRERMSPTCLDFKEMLSKHSSSVPCKWLKLASDCQRNPNHYSLKFYFSRQMYLTILLLLFCKLSYSSFLLFKIASFQKTASRTKLRAVQTWYPHRLDHLSQFYFYFKKIRN